MNYVYLDNNATTEPDSNMLGAVMDEVSNFYGNPSSPHIFGQYAKDSLERARTAVANCLGVDSNTIIFTSGGTEANNIAVFGTDLPLVASMVEHSSITNARPWYSLPVLPNGELNIEAADRMLKTIKSQVVVSVMLANNETGVILDPNRELLAMKNKYGFLLHVDAVQGFGKIIDYKVPEEVDMLSISAHKVHGLKGAGALHIKPHVDLNIHQKAGGHHEFGIRPGTENMSGIQSLAYMANKINENSHYRSRILNIKELRDKLENGLSSVSEVNGSQLNRIDNTTNLFFPDVKDTVLFVEILSEQGVAASGGSACSTGNPEPSRVLKAMFGPDDPRLSGSIRFSLSVNTTEEAIDIAIEKIKSSLEIYKEMQND